MRSGNRVVILAARKTPDLRTLCEDNLPADLAINATDGEVPVPGYLNRWDKHGFRFYYSPIFFYRTPKSARAKTYDPAQDFVFARDTGHVGLVLWDPPHVAKTAEGLMNTVWWDWVVEAYH